MHVRFQKDAAGSQSALTLSNVSGIFHILIGGLVLSMITSSIEYIVQRHLKSKTSKKVREGDWDCTVVVLFGLGLWLFEIINILLIVV